MVLAENNQFRILALFLREAEAAELEDMVTKIEQANPDQEIHLNLTAELVDEADEVIDGPPKGALSH